MYYYVRPDTLENEGLIAAIKEEVDGDGCPFFEVPPEQEGFVVVKIEPKIDETGLEASVHSQVSLVELLQTDNIDFHPHCLGGKPRLKGHRISVGQLVAQLLEITEDQVKEIADDFDLELEPLKAMFNDVAAFYYKCWGGNLKVASVTPQWDRTILSDFTMENRTFRFASPQEIQIWQYLPNTSQQQWVAEMKTFGAKGCGQTEEQAMQRMKEEFVRQWDRDRIQFPGVSVVALD